ncbi:MAG TPA: hypothetical protein VFN37_10760 [Candidatus Baltobacteraceae bacterium]|nr:hypothetical protein [Candidatus Baltobacteraceae bacterium]
MRPARTILAVLLGYLSLLAVELAGVLIFRGIIGGEFVTFISGLVAGAVTARVAAARPLLHASVLAVVIIAVTVFAAAFKRAPTPGVPAWYPYAAALLAGAGTFVGGALSSREKPAA